METTISLEKLEGIVRPHLKFLEAGNALSAEQSLGELGLDSMASIDLLLDLEDGFEIEISDDLITENSFTTLAEIANLIEASAE